MPGQNWFSLRVRPALICVYSVLLSFFFGACFSVAPLHRPAGSGREPIVRTGAGAALFTFVVREVNASRSRGLAWVSRRDSEDYRNYQQRLLNALSRTPGFNMVEEQKIFDSEAYRAGRFPINEKFFLNPGLLPVITSPEEETTMLRIGHTLGAEYLITALADHEIRKILGFSPRVEARVVVNIYSNKFGFLTALESEVTRVVSCPDPGDLPPHTACAGAIDSELDLAFESVFAETIKKLEQVQARPTGHPDLIRVETGPRKSILPEQKPYKHRFPTPR